MANLAPLTRFRKNDRKPLHSRWGDVSITAPTEGSWCQYDNPHKSAQRWRGYGPGFVPETAPRAVSRPRTRRDGGNHNGYRGDEVEERASNSSSSSSSMSSRNGSLSTSGKGMGALNPRRLSMRLGLAKDVDGGQGQRRQSINTKPEFAYKPTRQDYTTEVNHRASRFRYIPATPEYFDEVEMMNLSSLTPSRADQPRYIPGNSSEGSEHYGDEETAMQSRRGSTLFPRRALPGTSRQHQHQQQGNVVPVDKKKRHSRRPLTTVMVPGAEDIYG